MVVLPLSTLNLLVIWTSNKYYYYYVYVYGIIMNYAEYVELDNTDYFILIGVQGVWQVPIRIMVIIMEIL